MNDVIQLLEAGAPLQRNVSVQQLLSRRDVPRGINFKSVLVEESDHAGVGRPFLAGVVEWGAAASHSPRLVRSFRAPREDVRAGVPVEPLRQSPHHSLLDEIARLDRYGGERPIELTRRFVREGGLLHVDLGAVDFGFWVGCHGGWMGGEEAKKMVGRSEVGACRNARVVRERDPFVNLLNSSRFESDSRCLVHWDCGM